MGGGSWTTSDYVKYSTSVGRSTVTKGGHVTLDGLYTAQDIFKSTYLQPALNPLNVTRECKDTAEHPNTKPVILALDVTGSMGKAAVEVAKKLNEIMTELYSKVTDVEFLVMGIGDMVYDGAPVQASQFESDIRIAEQLDKVYFEFGGGGNAYESYTAAWYFGLNHTDLDCWKRGEKGIIITMGDETLNPYLPKDGIRRVFGDNVQAHVETEELYKAVTEKFNIYHLAVKDNATSYSHYASRIKETFGKYLDAEHLKTVGLNDIANVIIQIVTGSNKDTETTSNTEISW